MTARAHAYTDYVQWDVVNWSRAIDFWIKSIGPSALLGAEALEIGSRDGGLSLWLTHQGVKNVLCSDLSGPSEAAKKLHTKRGVSHLISYTSIDATDFSVAHEFDVIVFKSVLGGIGGTRGVEGQDRAMRQMYAALRPGGYLLFAENLKASPAHSALRRQYVSWAPAWRYVTIPEIERFSSSFTQLDVRTFGVIGAVGRTDMQRNFLGRVDRFGLERVFPAGWRYIVSGVAQK